jgi:hypothetical protein
VTVTSDTEDGKSYSVKAEHIERVNATYFRWKAALQPTEAGTGSHTIAAACDGCQSTSISSARAHDVVFGDVFVCSGRETLVQTHFLLFVGFIAPTELTVS